MRYGSYTQGKDGPVAAGGTVSTGTLIPEGADRVKGIIFSDQPGNLLIEQAFDEANNFWDLVTTYAIVANQGRGFSEEVVAPRVRVRFTSTGAGATGAFRLYANFSSAGAR